MNIKKERTFNSTWEVRKRALDQGNFKSYNEYLKSPLWQSIKLRASKKPHLNACFLCSESPVELHHNTYKNLCAGKKEDLRNIRAYCRYHHQQIHDISKRKDISVKRATKLLKKNLEKI